MAQTTIIIVKGTKYCACMYMSKELFLAICRLSASFKYLKIDILWHFSWHDLAWLRVMGLPGLTGLIWPALAYLVWLLAWLS